MRSRAGQRMAGRQRDQHLVVAQHVQLDPRDVQHGLEVVLEHDREIEAPVAQALGGGLGLGVLEAQLDAGVRRAERGDGGRHQDRAGAGEGGEPQAPGARVDDRVELVAGQLQALAQRGGVAGEHGAGLGQPDAARPAVEERGAGLALERGHRLRDGGGRVGERGGRGGHRALAGDGVEDQEPARVEHAAELNAGVRSLRWSAGVSRGTLVP